MFTTEASIKDTALYSYLEARAKEYQYLLRKLHVEVNCNQQDEHQVVKKWLHQYGWSARQLNAVRIQLGGMTSGWKEALTNRIEEQKTRNQKLKKVIHDLQKRITKKKSTDVKWDRFMLHQYKRRLHRLEDKLAAMEKQDLEATPNFCFGGKELFRKQHNLQANGYNNHEEWLADWQGARSKSFMLVGRAKDAYGNSDCQMEVIYSTDKKIYAEVRLCGLNREITGKKAKPTDYHCFLVTFSYNIQEILGAVANHQALSFRFLLEGGKWKLHLMTELPKITWISNAKNGAMGIDQNPECVVEARISWGGNPQQVITHAVKQKLSANQAKHLLGNIIAKIVANAVLYKVPIVLERLDFPQLQREIRSRGLNRLLSKFKFALFEQMLKMRAAKFGIQVITVNPAFSSIVGYFKFGHGCNLNRHESAAVAIARRIIRPSGRKFSERLRFRVKHPNAPTMKALKLPVTDGKRHPWRSWRKFGKLLAKSTRHGKIHARPAPAAGGSRKGGSKVNSPQVARCPAQDKLETAANLGFDQGSTVRKKGQSVNPTDQG